MRMVLQEAARAYKEGTDADIHQLIQEMEDNVMERDFEPKMEERGDIIPDTGHTRGRMTLYK